MAKKYQLTQDGPEVQALLNKIDGVRANQTPGQGVEPIPMENLSLDGVLYAFLTSAVSNLLYYYTKSETYSKSEVDALVAAIKQFTIQSVDQLPQPPSAATTNILYLVPAEEPKVANEKDEFITVIKDGAYVWEQVGSTAIDLSGYVTNEALNAALADYVTSDALSTALAGLHDVKYTAQSLTAEQKAQARTNIGATAPEVFWAVYNTTSYEDILAAYNAGKVCLATRANDVKVYLLGQINEENARFYCTQGQYSYELRRNKVGAWQAGTTTNQRTNDRVDTIVGNEEATNLYPSTKAVADALAPKYEKPQTGIPAGDLADDVIPDISGKADKVQNAIAGHLAGLNAAGNPTDTGLTPLDIPLFPDMDGLTPIQTIEYDLTKNEWCKLFERVNPEGTVASDVTEVIACRVTVTGDNMDEPQVIDIVATGPGRLNRQFFAVFRALTPDISAAHKYGIYQLRNSCPKALGSGYGWVVDFNPYYAVRHIKVEVFKTAPTVVFYSEHTKTNTSSTYQAVGSSQVADGTKSFNNLEVSINGASTSAAYITGYLMPLLSTVIQTGEAIITNQICFIGADGKAYPVSNTVQAINPDAFVFVAGTGYAINKDISTAYLRTITASVALNAATNPNVEFPTFAKGDQLFLRCHMSNGALYSDAVITTAISPGYTWIALGYAPSATALAFSTHGKEFFTLDANGKLTHVNGKEIAVPASGVQDVTLGGTSVVSGGVAVLPEYPTVPTIESMTAQEVTTAVDTAWGNVMGS